MASWGEWRAIHEALLEYPGVSPKTKWFQRGVDLARRGPGHAVGRQRDTAVLDPEDARGDQRRLYTSSPFALHVGDRSHGLYGLGHADAGSRRVS